MTNIAFIGTGFVADYYLTTLRNYPELELKTCWDRNGDRLAQFCAYHNAPAADSFEAVLADPDIEIIVNLTTPESHYTVNRAALEAGKHVYCEKPLAMDAEKARDLAACAGGRGLTLHTAPANVFSPSFMTVREALHRGDIGEPRMVYAEMEDGPVFWDNWREWTSESGAPWPGMHEFEIGCTLEHAGYALSWLLALFGPVERLSATTQLVFPDKGTDTPPSEMAPDLAIGLLSFQKGVAARLSCGLAAERNRSLTIMGDRGILSVADLWDWSAPVRLQTCQTARNIPERVVGWAERKRGHTLPLQIAGGSVISGTTPPPGNWSLPNFPSRIDFAAGIDAQARAISTGRPGLLAGDLAVHMSEVTLALQAGERDFKPPTGFEFAASTLADWPAHLRSSAGP